MEIRDIVDIANIAGVVRKRESLPVQASGQRFKEMFDEERTRLNKDYDDQGSDSEDNGLPKRTQFQGQG